MSTTIVGYVMIGVRLSDILTTEETSDPVTKYDEDTGKPYVKQVPRRIYRVCGREVPGPSSTSGGIFPTDWLGEVLGFDENVHNKPGCLTVQHCGGWLAWQGDHSEALKHRVFGALFRYAPAYRDDQQIVGGDLPSEAEVAVARDALAKLGYTGPIGMYLVVYVSS